MLVCEACWVEKGCPVIFDEMVEECARLIGDLYVLCPTGGPLHAELDDMNLNGEIRPLYAIPAYRHDHYVSPEIPDNYSPEVHQICDRIAELMSEMTVGQRISAVAHFEGWAAQGARVPRA